MRQADPAADRHSAKLLPQASPSALELLDADSLRGSVSAA
jgi:hypothetical protein